MNRIQGIETLSDQEAALQKAVASHHAGGQVKYSADIRNGVMELVRCGGNIARLSRVLNISHVTLHDWVRKANSSGGKKQGPTGKRAGTVRQLHVLANESVADQPMKIYLGNRVVIEVPMGVSIQWIGQLVSLGASCS